MNRIFGQKKPQAPMPTLGKEKRRKGGREGGREGGHDIGLWY
jgi:hypothetical protein